MVVSVDDLMRFDGLYLDEPVPVGSHVLAVVLFILDVVRRRIDKTRPRALAALDIAAGDPCMDALRNKRDLLVEKSIRIGADMRWLCREALLRLGEKTEVTNRGALVRATKEALRWHAEIAATHPQLGLCLSHNVGILLRRQPLPLRSGLYDSAIVASDDAIALLRSWLVHFSTRIIKPPASLPPLSKALDFCIARLQKHEDRLH